MDKTALSERDICTKYITPAIARAGWDVHTPVREEVQLTKGRVVVRGKLVSRGTPKRSDYLYYQPNLLIAVLEAKDNHRPVGAGTQQAIGYADKLGRAAIWHGEFPVCLHQDCVCRAQPFSGAALPMASEARELSRREVLLPTASKQITDPASIKIAQLRNLPCAIPPLVEQRRIVKRRDRHMGLCDELERNLTRARTMSESLAVAVVHHLTAA